MKLKGRISSASSNSLRIVIGASVFVNAPFSARRRRAFDAIIFALRYCRMKPIIAPHRKGSGESRLDFIIQQARSECRYSVHDITPVGGAKARYNMAFELGVCLGLGHGDSCLIFADDRQFIAERFSDLAGRDIERHDGDGGEIARKVAVWLTKCCPHDLPTPAEVKKAFLKFHAPFAKECEKKGWQSGDDLSVRVKYISRWIAERLPE